ncbi:hypothetical protein QUF76_03090 [Desulfobacterales bacterium HSG16]|nr:hypothetical protein [Desulfobacterales bacterium HSG16]
MSEKRLLSVIIICSMLIWPVFARAAGPVSSESGQPSIDTPEAAEKPSGGHLKIMVNMPNVKIYLNGKIEGLAHPSRPLTREYLPTGQILLRGVVKEHEPVTKTIEIIDGKTIEAMLNFVPKPNKTSEAAKKKQLKKKAEQDKKPENQSVEGLFTIDQILTSAETCFQKKRYTLPKGDNAFDYCRTIIRAEPENLNAKELIYKIMNIYRSWAIRERETKKVTKSLKHWQQYLRIGEYAVRTFDDHKLAKTIEIDKQQINHIGKNVDSLKEKLKKADTYFIAQHFTLPKKKNAFDIYMDVLAEDLTNRSARSRIREMMKYYRKWGDSAWTARRFSRAIQFYEQYLYIVDTVSELLPNSKYRSQAASIRKRIRRQENIRSLLKKADNLFAAGSLKMPEDKNAFDIYTKVLKISPGNARAEKKQLAILRHYLREGDQAFEEGRNEDAKRAWTDYLYLADRVLNSKNEALIRPIYDRVVSDIGKSEKQFDLTRLSDLKKSLDANNKLYEQLKIKEQEDIDVALEIIEVMNKIISDMKKIEIELGKGTSFDDHILEIKNARKGKENEIQLRKSKVF